MPGSANFIGEFNILLGTFQSKLPIAIIATAGVVGAAYYALRLFVGAMHNRVGPKVTSREIGLRDAVVLVPIVLVILALAFYPQFGLRPLGAVGEGGDRADAGRAAGVGLGRRRRSAAAMIALAAVHHLKGPHIDWAAFSPLLALAGGGLIVLMVGLLPSRLVRHRVVPVLTIIAFAASIGLAIWRFHHPASIISGALRIDDLALSSTCCSRSRGSRPCCCRGATPRRARRATASTTRCCC